MLQEHEPVGTCERRRGAAIAPIAGYRRRYRVPWADSLRKVFAIHVLAARGAKAAWIESVNLEKMPWVPLPYGRKGSASVSPRVRTFLPFYAITAWLVLINLVDNARSSDYSPFAVVAYTGAFWFLVVFTVLARTTALRAGWMAAIASILPVAATGYYALYIVSNIGDGRGLREPSAWVLPGLPLAEALSDRARAREERRRDAETPDVRTATMAALLASRWIDLDDVWFGAQRNGKLLVLAEAASRDGRALRLFRFHGDGSADATFGLGAVLEPGTRVALAPDDRILTRPAGGGTGSSLRLHDPDGALLGEYPLPAQAVGIGPLRFGADGRLYGFLAPRPEPSRGAVDQPPPTRLALVEYDLTRGLNAPETRDLSWILRATPGLRDVDDFHVGRDGAVLVTVRIDAPAAAGESRTEDALIAVSVKSRRSSTLRLPDLSGDLSIPGEVGGQPLVVGRYSGAVLIAESGPRTIALSALDAVRAPAAGGYSAGWWSSPAVHSDTTLVSLERSCERANGTQCHPVAFAIVPIDGGRPQRIRLPGSP